MRKLFVVLGATVLLTACGGGGGLKKDTKADYQLNQADLEGKGNLPDAERDTYDNKVIEIKGVIKSPKKAEHAASPNKYSFYLCSSADQEDTAGTICYSDEDPSANTGKTVTVKGKFSYAGVVTLVDCVIY